MTSAALLTKKIFIGGNFKCNPSTVSALNALIDGFNSCGEFPSNAQVVIAPTSLHLPIVKDRLKRADVELAVQNLWKSNKVGAWTGELTVDLVKDFGGIKWAILGHSERRATVSAESSELIAEEIGTALQEGMSVIACVGEKLEERKAGKTMDIVTEQLFPMLAHIKDWTNVVIAYEPVWAIGTGVVATPEQAQETHENIRTWLSAKVGKTVANSTRIVYGGSVTAANCADLIKKPDIDGFLVGGASLKPEFFSIIQSAALKSKM